MCTASVIKAGVQVRKLYESSKYPGSFLVSQFAHHFGSGPRDNVCAFAFEPNPRHYPRLREIEAVYNSLGWRVMMIPAAVGIRNSTMYLTQPPSDLQQGARVSSTKPTHGDVVAVPIIDLVEFLREHITSRTYTSRENSAGKIVCKMDIEGAEFQVLPAMLTSGQLCALDVIYTEFHNRNAAHFLNSTTPVTYDRIMKLRDSIQTVMTESDQCSTLVRSLDDESYGRDSLASKPLPLYHGAPQHCADKDARCILTKPLNGMSEEEHRNSVLGPF